MEIRSPNQYAPSAKEMLLRYKVSAWAAHERRQYAERDRWCAKYDSLMLKLIVGQDDFERIAA